MISVQVIVKFYAEVSYRRPSAADVCSVVGWHCLQRPAHWRWLGIQRFFCPNKSTVNEQKVDEMHVNPAIANALVGCSLFFHLKL
jgi:hypothetical protein